jgi:hypothetical protein
LHKKILTAILTFILLATTIGMVIPQAAAYNLRRTIQPAPTTVYPSTVSFSGYTWYIENTQQPCNPGPNYWSNSPENVWVDENGWLHLKITQRNGKWYCAELTTIQTLGYGTYAFYLASRTDNLDKNVVLGLFAYKDDTHEVDIEFSKWGITNNQNGWFTVQPPPYIDGKNQKAFNFELSGDYTTHYFTWSRRSIYFESFHGHYPVGTQPQGNVIESFTSYQRVSAQGVKAHINLWLYKGLAPSDGLPTEVVIKSFTYTP